jgi:enamine deaminase RidA (YjgF/YER057c/UK114 family)
MEWSHLNPPDLPDWSTFFSQVVCVEAHGTRQVFVAGQVGVDAGKRLAGDGGFEAQTERAFDNLGAALGHASGRWADVAMLTIYGVGDDGSQGPVLGRAIRARFPAGRLPACSLVGVQALAEPRFLIEVEAVAVVAVGARAEPGDAPDRRGT